MHRRDPTSRRRDAPGERSDEATQEKKERLAIVHLVFEVVVFLEEFLQLGEAERTSQTSRQPQPQFHSLVPETRRDLLAPEPGEGPQRGEPPELEFLPQLRPAFGDEKGKPVELDETLGRV